MDEIIVKTVIRLNKMKEERNYLEWKKDKLNKNIYAMKKKIFNDWLNNNLIDERFFAEMDLLGIDFGKSVGIIVIKLKQESNFEVINPKWTTELVKLIINIVKDKFEECDSKFVFDDDGENIILINKIENMNEWAVLGNELREEIDRYLKCNVIIKQINVSDGILKIKEVYSSIFKFENEKTVNSPIALHAIRYIEDNYYLNELTINILSEKLQITPSYLSKLLKKETGLSFIDYLTNVRIRKAINIMKDPTIKIYDVAELIGYSNQHYFCRTFKKVIGVSPTQYKKQQYEKHINVH